jgi:hypothetical protein
MRRLLSALPYLFLGLAVVIAGWMAWSIIAPTWEGIDVDGEGAETTSTSAPTSTRPADWVESCEVVMATLMDGGWAISEEAAGLHQATADAQAGVHSWYGAVDIAEDRLIPRLQELIDSAEQVLATDPDTVSRVYAAAFRDAATPLLAQAQDLITSVIDPETVQVNQSAWTAWWADWSDSLQQLTNVLGRSLESARNCPG